jgi:hypothetical protein
MEGCSRGSGNFAGLVSAQSTCSLLSHAGIPYQPGYGIDSSVCWLQGCSRVSRTHAQLLMHGLGIISGCDAGQHWRRLAVDDCLYRTRAMSFKVRRWDCCCCIMVGVQWEVLVCVPFRAWAALLDSGRCTVEKVKEGEGAAA